MFYDRETYEQLIESGRVTTWADGHGRWHALVPKDMLGMIVARGAIWHELRERYTTTTGETPARPNVERVHDSRKTMTHWVECDD